MKNSLLIHTTWAIIVVVAFMIGVKKPVDETPSYSTENDTNSGDRYTRRSQQRGASGTTQGRVASRGSRALGVPMNSKKIKINLTEKGIKSLGQMIQTSNNPVERRIAFSRLLEGLTHKNAVLIREQITHMSSRAGEWRDFHYAWGQLAGQASVEFGQDSKEMDMAACFSGWASANPRAAMDWYESQPDDSKNRKDIKWAAVHGLSDNDPIFATEYVLNRFENGDKDAGKMINHVASSLLRVGSVIDAAQWSENLPEGKLRDTAVGRVARDYAGDDPSKAIAWLTSLPESQGQSKGVGAVFYSWAKSDPEAAVSRINQMGVSPIRDTALAGYAGRIVYQDPAAAIDLANTISNPKSRSDSLVRYGRIYLRHEPEAATQWLAESGLTADQKKRINSSYKRR
ncbi:MAG TPA: hypothetical protein DHW77_09255 [Verrucomicrobiales bacterium]|nr:hypothetical protein [Verrucomicrobiales bacterium]